MCGSKLYWHHHHHHHLAKKEMDHLVTLSGTTLQEVSLMASYGFFRLLACSVLLFSVKIEENEMGWACSSYG